MTLLVVLFTLGAVELWWRAHGFGAEVQAVDEAWILNMHRLNRATTVALGTSRIRAALDPVAFRGVVGGTAPINLALPGSSPVPVLEYLADSTRYAGLVIVEVLPVVAFDAEQRSSMRVTSLLARYGRERASPARLVEDWLRVHLLGHVVFRTTQLLPVRLVSTLRAGRLLQPDIGHMQPDGFAPKDQRSRLKLEHGDPVMGFAGPHKSVLAAAHPPNAAEFSALRKRIDRASERVRARGGTVVLLYMAACGRLREIEDQLYPRAQYWDLLVRETHAISIATEDFPALSQFDCFDGSHIDAADAPRFSVALGRLIQGRH